MEQKKRKTLLIGGDFFIRKILNSLKQDKHEPIIIDILEKKKQTKYDPISVAAVQADFDYPDGCRCLLYEYVDVAANVVFIQELPGQNTHTIPLNELLSGYEKIVIWSISPENAREVISAVNTKGSDNVYILCADDEIDRHYIFQVHKRKDPDNEVKLRELLLYSNEVETAFELAVNYLIPPNPWGAMIQTGRTSPLNIIPFILPVKNESEQEVIKDSGVYRLIAFPKPSVSLQYFYESINAFVSRFVSSLQLEVITFRNDHPSFKQIEHQGKAFVVKSYPYPIFEKFYHHIVSSANGVIIVPRGGFSTIKNCIRYGMDIFSFDGFSPNLITLTDTLKSYVVNISTEEKIVCDEISGQVFTREQVMKNKTSLYKSEDESIRWFKNTFLG
jgi:hypothetical protein